jgi:RNA polymerase sigma-70 factor, ECF subfamily
MVAGEEAMSDAEPRHARHEFEDLVLPHLEALARLARFLVPQNRAEAEDLVQGALLRAYTAFPRFQPGTNLRAWLFRILRNTWVELLRRQGRAADALTELGWESLPTSEALRAEAARAASEADVEAALGRLPGDLRVALLLVDGGP